MGENRDVKALAQDILGDAAEVQMSVAQVMPPLSSPYGANRQEVFNALCRIQISARGLLGQKEAGFGKIADGYRADVIKLLGGLIQLLDDGTEDSRLDGIDDANLKQIALAADLAAVRINNYLR
ncbi:hypothetical protein ACFL6N_07965, partial [Thermodesulfobacteriota bacterium]